MDFVILITFLSALAFIIPPFFTTTRNAASTFWFKVIPFLLGLANIVAFLILSGFVVKG